jgi:hypothetical protein
MSTRTPVRVAAVSAVVLATVLATLTAATSASAAPTPTTRQVLKGGTAAYRPVPTGSGALAALATEIAREPEVEEDEGDGASAAKVLSAAGPSVSSAASPTLADGVIIRNGPQLLRSFDGLNHRDQRTANGGNQFSVEPPDQALCVGGGHVVEATNDVFRVFAPDGTPQTGVVDLNTFFGYPAQFNRTTGLQGPFVTDPVCLFDPTTRAFFLVVLTLEVVPDTGEFTGDNHLDIAVTSDPLGTWNIYRLNVTDDGREGTPVHPHCPCIGDFPHIGVDANGFFLTTNEYSFFGPEFNSAQIYAFSKRALARGDDAVLVTQFDTTGADRGLNGFTIWPAQSPTTGDYSRAAGGTEFALSSNAGEEANGVPGGQPSNSIVAWSITNTRSLDTASPNLFLNDTRVSVRTYSPPPRANQKPGPIPLAECLNDDPCATNVILGAPDPFKPEVLATPDASDSRMMQTTYADGKLYGALDTAMNIAGATKAGIGWYIVRPDTDRTSVHARLAAQGQLGLAGNNLTYPAIGVNSEGKGVMAFTLLGDGYFPTAAYAAFDGRTGAGSIFVARLGVGPQDGFTGYKALVGDPPRPRWGDYGATAIDGTNIWIASEYIGQTCTLAQYLTPPIGSCGGTRTALANWATRVSLVKP